MYEHTDQQPQYRYALHHGHAAITEESQTALEQEQLEAAMLPCQMSQPLQPLMSSAEYAQANGLCQPDFEQRDMRETTSKFDGIPDLDVCQQCLGYEARLAGEASRADDVHDQMRRVFEQY